MIFHKKETEKNELVARPAGDGDGLVLLVLLSPHLASTTPLKELKAWWTAKKYITACDPSKQLFFSVCSFHYRRFPNKQFIGVSSIQVSFLQLL